MPGMRYQTRHEISGYQVCYPFQRFYRKVERTYLVLRLYIYYIRPKYLWKLALCTKNPASDDTTGPFHHAWAETCDQSMCTGEYRRSQRIRIYPTY